MTACEAEALIAEQAVYQTANERTTHTEPRQGATVETMTTLRTACEVQAVFRHPGVLLVRGTDYTPGRRCPTRRPGGVQCLVNRADKQAIGTRQGATVETMTTLRPTAKQQTNKQTTDKEECTELAAHGATSRLWQIEAELRIEWTTEHRNPPGCHR